MAGCCVAPRVPVLALLSLPLLAGAMPTPATHQPAPVSRNAASLRPAPASPPAAAASARATGPAGRAAEGRELPYRITPERRALLNTIRYAEGTWLGGSADGYRVIYGGGKVDSLERHPEITVRRGYVSAAAGAYQFLPRTWEAAARRLGLDDFGPEAQDQAALHLIERRGALSAFDRQGLSPDVLARLAPEWASLPSVGGGSYYGQPVKGVGELQAFFEEELSRQRDLARTGRPSQDQA